MDSQNIVTLSPTIPVAFAAFAYRAVFPVKDPTDKSKTQNMYVEDRQMFGNSAHEVFIATGTLASVACRLSGYFLIEGPKDYLEKTIVVLNEDYVLSRNDTRWTDPELLLGDAREVARSWYKDQDFLVARSTNYVFRTPNMDIVHEGDDANIVTPFGRVLRRIGEAFRVRPAPPRSVINKPEGPIIQ